MTTPHVMPIGSQPGIARDGTQLDTEFHLDGQWVRWYKSRPKKIGGYRSITAGVPNLTRGMTAFAEGQTVYSHMGSRANLVQVQSDYNSQLRSQTDRTPASGFTPDPNNLWQFDYLYDFTAGVTNLIAHAAPNLTYLANNVQTNIFSGQVDTEGVLTQTGMDPQSGGILVLEPYLLTFGNGGRVDISNPNDLVSPPYNSASVTNSKIIKGLPLRGTGGLPAGLLWSTNALLRAVFTSTAAGIFGFDTLSDSIAPFSSSGIVEQDGIYYWVDTGRFMMFNGVVQEIPNELNLNFFFDNINPLYQQKVFAVRIPRWGEIWWCFPLGTATECNHAVIYNYRYQTWYDTALPDSGRSAGIFCAPYPYPLMVGVDENTSGQYVMWSHENGVDKVIGSQALAIDSYFQTGFIAAPVASQPVDKATRVAIIEPDFVQTGPMSVTVLGQANARAENVAGQPFVFPDLSDAPLDPGEQVATVKEERRLLSFKFESNVAGGDYLAGKSIAHIEPTTGRITT